MLTTIRPEVNTELEMTYERVNEHLLNEIFASVDPDDVARHPGRLTCAE
jgi:hypothetical protein